MTKHRQGRPDRTAFSETGMSETERMIQEARQRQAGPISGRGKPAHAGRLGIDNQGRAKLSADVAVNIQDDLRDLADQEQVAVSDLVEAALRYFLEAHAAGLVDLGPFKIPARSLRYTWKLTLPAEKSFFSATRQR